MKRPICGLGFFFSKRKIWWEGVLEEAVRGKGKGKGERGMSDGDGDE